MTDRVAIVTGASGGIGHAVAMRLAQDGMAVAVHYAGSTNVRGTFVVSQRAARRVREGGAIVNFSSSVTKLALPTYTAYAATKGAVDAMTLILAKEMRGRDVTVNAVAPGPTATPLFLDGKPQQAIDTLRNMSPLERLGEPHDIAEAVAFLAGPARWINGQIIYTNGGVI
jgi:3-oxoacyl-[acyl-carrier protein] reductase